MRLTFVGKDPESNPTGSPTVPGNDFYLLDDRLVVFLIYTGSGLAAGKVTSTDPADIQLCRSAFEAVWKLSISHSDYKPH